MDDIDDELSELLHSTSQVRAMVKMLKDRGYQDAVLDNAMEQMALGYEFEELAPEQQEAVIDGIDEALRALRQLRKPPLH